MEHSDALLPSRQTRRPWAPSRDGCAPAAEAGPGWAWTSLCSVKWLRPLFFFQNPHLTPAVDTCRLFYVYTNVHALLKFCLFFFFGQDMILTAPVESIWVKVAVLRFFLLSCPDIDPNPVFLPHEQSNSHLHFAGIVQKPLSSAFVSLRHVLEPGCLHLAEST